MTTSSLSNFEPEDLDLQRYVRAVFRRIWLVAAVTALVIALFMVWSSAKDKLTTASITLQTSNPAGIHPLMRSTSASQELLAIRSVSLINHAENAIGEGSTSLDLVNTRQPLGTDFIEISLTSASSENAFHRLEVYAETFRTERQRQIAEEATQVRKVLEANLSLAQTQADELRGQIRAIDASKPNATPLGQALAERLGAITTLSATIDNLDFFVDKGPISIAFQSDVPIPENSSLLKRLIPGIVVGILAGLLAALSVDLMLDRVSSRRELERTLLSVHILGESSTASLPDSMASTVASGIRLQASERGLRRVVLSGTASKATIQATAKAIQARSEAEGLELVSSAFRADDNRFVPEVMDFDGYVLIVSARSTGRRTLVSAVSRIQEVQRPLVGVVLVNVRRADRSAAARSLEIA